ncbi:MAG: hypothetical protein LUQ50_12250 [Methanospirillum sp.]|uniref:hypothetical protein n=1 Tax=Methanospirillum sp. TaxID=45200 RepID=UPI00236EB2FA|nr:hypothetical protein [Methanospirillum sp.]MDD1729828.1 hypothetical protein [Methanospirillum sp.]
MIREQIADTLTGGQLSQTREQLTSLTGRYQDVLSETRKLSRDIENLKEGYADQSWNNRLALDRQWLLISGYQQQRVIQKSDVDLYHDLLNYGYQYSPLIRGAIDLKTRYTFGLSFSIQSNKRNYRAIIDTIRNDPKNQLALFGSQALIEADHELQKGGNVFLAIWHKLTPVQIRVWSSYEIGDIITDPEDADLPMFYIRSWIDSSGNQHTKAYPSLFNTKYAGMVNQDGVSAQVDKDVIVFHLAEGKGLKQKWALSPYTAALPWNRAYEGFLLDFAAIVQMIRKYTTMFTTTGGNAQVSAISSQFNHEQHGHHKGQVGNQLVATEGNDFKVVDAGSNKIVGPADSQYFLRQFCTATGVPENMLTGNPQTGNRASAQELTANFLPLIEERQTAWADTFKVIFTRILGTADFEISFPPLRSQDAITYLQSLCSAATLGNPSGGLAGVIRPIDLIKAIYESLDLKIPDETTVDEMVASLMDKMTQNPDMAAAIERLATAATQLQEAGYGHCDH